MFEGLWVCPGAVGVIIFIILSKFLRQTQTGLVTMHTHLQSSLFCFRNCTCSVDQGPETDDQGPETDEVVDPIVVLANANWHGG